MDEDRERYVEDFGILIGEFGLPRIVGRVLGALLVSDPPERAAKELAEALRASRGSISSATRTLVQLGLVERRTRTGERRDYFRVRPGAWRELMHRELEALSTFRQMAERGRAHMDSSKPGGKERTRRDARPLRLLGARTTNHPQAVGTKISAQRKAETLTVFLA